MKGHMKFREIVAMGFVITLIISAVIPTAIGQNGGTYKNSKSDTHLRDIWNRTYGNFKEAGNDFANRITWDGDRHVYITGTTRIPGNKTDIFLMKVDIVSRSIMWERFWGTWGFDSGNGITMDNDGYIYVIGTTNYSSALSADIIILKYDQNGNLIKQKYWDINGDNDRGKSIVYDPVNNALYITGITRTGSLSYGLDALTARLDTNLNVVWKSTYHNTTAIRPDGGFDIDVDSSGNVYVIGGSYTGLAKLEDVLLLKYDSNGNLIWDRTIDLSDGHNDFGWRLTVLNTVVGWRVIGLCFSVDAIDNQVNASIVIYDTDGNFKRVINMQGVSGNVSFDFDKEHLANGGISSDGTYIYVTGESRNRGATSNDTYFMKFDFDGNNIFQKYWDKPGRDFGRDLTPVGNNYYVVGSLWNTTNFDGYILDTNDNGGGNVPEISSPALILSLVALILPVTHLVSKRNHSRCR